MSKDKVEVAIGGQIYKISGEESAEHIQEVAQKINKHYDEIRAKIPNHKYTDVKVLIAVAINMGNDCLKIEKELESCIKELAKSENENMALMERIEELSLEIATLRTKQNRG